MVGKAQGMKGSVNCKVCCICDSRALACYTCNKYELVSYITAILSSSNNCNYSLCIACFLGVLASTTGKVVATDVHICFVIESFVLR